MQKVSKEEAVKVTRIPRGCEVVGTFPLTALEGTVTGEDDYSVTVVMREGTFQVLGEASFSNQFSGHAAAALKTHMQTTSFGSKRLLLGTGSYGQHTLSCLKPSQFFVTSVRNDLATDGQLLIYIMTDGRRSNSGPTAGNVGDLHDMLMREEYQTGQPIAVPYSAALYIRSELVFKDILKPKVCSQLLPVNLKIRFWFTRLFTCPFGSLDIHHHIQTLENSSKASVHLFTNSFGPALAMVHLVYNSFGPTLQLIKARYRQYVCISPPVC